MRPRSLCAPRPHGPRVPALPSSSLAARANHPIRARWAYTCREQGVHDFQCTLSPMRMLITYLNSQILDKMDYFGLLSAARHMSMGDGGPLPIGV